MGASARKVEGSVACFLVCAALGRYAGLELDVATVAAAVVTLGEVLAEVIGLDGALAGARARFKSCPSICVCLCLCHCACVRACFTLSSSTMPVPARVAYTHSLDRTQCKTSCV